MQSIVDLNIMDKYEKVNACLPIEYAVTDDLFKLMPFQYYPEDGDKVAVIDLVRLEVYYSCTTLYYNDIYQKKHDIISLINKNINTLDGSLFLFDVNKMQFIWNFTKQVPMVDFIKVPPSKRIVLMFGTDNIIRKTTEYSGLHNLFWISKGSKYLIKQDYVEDPTCFINIAKSYFGMEISDPNVNKAIINPQAIPPSDEFLSRLRAIKYTKKAPQILKLSYLLHDGKLPKVDKITSITIDISKEEMNRLVNSEIIFISANKSGGLTFGVHIVPKENKLPKLLNVNQVAYEVLPAIVNR